MKVANKYIFDIKPYVPGKPIEDVKREFGLKKVIKLASNENPYPASPKVLKAIASASRDINRYPDGGCFVLRQALAKHLKVNADQLIFGNGSDEVIVLAVKAFVGEGDEVVIAQPSFLIYEIASRLAGAKIHSVPLVNFRYDLPAMAARITKKTKMIFIGNPDNPAGTYVDAKALESFIKDISSDVIIFLDEAYAEYVDAANYPNSMALLKKYPNLIVTRTFSKMYGLAGLRVGYGVASPTIIDILNRLREPFNVNSLAQHAAVAALADKPYYRRIAADIKRQRQFLYRSLTGMGLRVEDSFTNFMLVKVDGDSTTVAKGLLKQGVIIRDMAAWGLKGYIRVSIGTGQENKFFIKALTKIIRTKG